MKRFLVLLLLTIGVSPALAVNYYVLKACANNGNGVPRTPDGALDTNDCATTPGGTGVFNDISGCDAALNPGDTCFIGNGDYVPAAITGRPAFFSGYGPQRSGTAGNPITYTHYPGHSPRLCSWANCDTSTANTAGNYTNYLGTAWSSGRASDQGGRDFLVFDGLTVLGGISMYGCDTCEVKNSDIQYGAGDLNDGNWCGVRPDYSNNLKLTNNYIHNMLRGLPDRASGMTAFEAPGMVITYNTFYNIQYQAVNLKQNDDNVTISYNAAFQIGLNGGGGESTFQYCTQAGTDPTTGTLISYNVMASSMTHNDVGAVTVFAGACGGTHTLDHNTFYACTEALTVRPSTPTHVFTNNVVYCSASPNEGGLLANGNYGGEGGTLLTLNNNAYQSTQFNGSGGRWKDLATNYDGIAAWRTHLGAGKENASQYRSCAMVSPTVPTCNASGVCTGDFHITDTTCKTLSSTGGYVGALISDTACVGYGCAVTPPVGTDYYVRTDGNDTTCGGLADDSRANAATLKTSCTDTNGDGVIQSTEPCTACAYATVGKCAATVTAPGRCNIKPGLYTETGITQANSGALVNASLRTDCTCTNNSTTVTCGGTIPTAALGQFVKCATGPYFSWSRVLSNNGSTLTLSEPYRGDTSSSPGADTLALANFIEIKGTGNNKSDATITSWVDKPADVTFTLESGTSCVYSYTKIATANATWQAPAGFRDKNTTWDTWRLNSNGRDAYIGVQNSTCPCSYSSMKAQLDELPGSWSDGYCSGGTRVNQACVADSDCPGAISCIRDKAFVHTRRTCTGGTMSGYSCLADVDCLGGGTCGACVNPNTTFSQAAMPGYLFTSNKDYTIVDNLTFERGVYMRPDEAKVDQEAVRLGGNHARYSNLDVLTGQLGIVPQTGFSGAATSATLYSGIRALDSTWCTMDATKAWSGLKFYNVEMRGGVGNLMQCNGVRGISTTDRVIFDRIYAHRNFTGLVTNTGTAPYGCGLGNTAEWDCSTHYWAASGERQYRGNHGIYNLSSDVVSGQYADHIMFRNSIVDETSDGVQFGGGGNGTDIWFVNNTFGAYENANISHRLQALFGCATGTGCGTNSGGAAKLYNNLFYQKQAGYFSGPWIGRYAQTDPTLIVSDYNYFLEPNLNATPGEDRVWTLSSPTETLSYVRSTYSQEAHSILGCGSNCASRGWGANYFDLAGVSGLTDVTVRDGTPTNYTPLAGFKGIDAGNSTYGTYEDFYGNVRSGTPDIGAVEYLGATQTCGNGVKEGTELCDPGPPQEDLGGNSCTTIGGGFTGGTLHCNPTCNGWNTSGCTGAASATKSGVAGATLSGGSLK